MLTESEVFKEISNRDLTGLIRHRSSHFYVKSKFRVFKAFKFTKKVSSFVIHSDNKEGKVTAAGVCERGFKQMSTEMAVCKPAAENINSRSAF